MNCCHRFLGDVQHNKIMAELMDEAIEISHKLIPCNICGRTFLPSPLKKHYKVCEKNATRKRKTFNSLKQRIEGTELAVFHQKSFLRKTESSPHVVPSASATSHVHAAVATNDVKEKRNQSKWKEKHEELVQAIRAAKGEKDMAPRRSISAVGSMGTTEQCPSCDRHFGPKAYDRHVEWCKEHKIRASKSPAVVTIAKERLEARTKYRVPPLNKSKRSITRDKYASPASRTNNDQVLNVRSTSSLERTSTRKPKQSSGTVASTQNCKPLAEPVIKNNAEKLKSSNFKYRVYPLQKMNDSDVNASVLGMTVSHMNLCSPSRPVSSCCPPIPLTPKLIAWKDTQNETENENKSNVSKTNDSLPFTINLVSDNETKNNNEHNDNSEPPPPSGGGYLDTIPEEDDYYHQYLPTIVEESESCQIVTIKAPISTTKMCDTSDSSDLSTKRSEILDNKKDDETSECCTFQETLSIDYPEEFRSSTPVQDDKTGSFSIDATSPITTKPGFNETPIIVVGDKDSSTCFADNSARDPAQNLCDKSDVEIIYHNRKHSNSPQHDFVKEKEHFRIEISPRHFKSYSRKNEEYYSENSPGDDEEEEEFYDDTYDCDTSNKKIEYIEEDRRTPDQEWQDLDGNLQKYDEAFYDEPEYSDKLIDDRKSHKKKSHKKNRYRNMSDHEWQQEEQDPSFNSYRNSQYEEDSEDSYTNELNDVEEYYHKSHKKKRNKKKFEKNWQYDEERKSKRHKNRLLKEKEIGELVLDKFLKEKKTKCRLEVEIIAGEKTTVKGKPKMYRVNSSEIVIRGDKCIDTLNKSFSRNKIKHVNIVFVNEDTNDESEITLESDLNVKHNKDTFVIESQGFDVPVTKKCARKQENKARAQRGDNFWAQYTQNDDDECLSEIVDSEHDSEHNLSLPPINIKNRTSNEQSPVYSNPHKFHDSPTRFPPIFDKNNQSFGNNKNTATRNSDSKKHPLSPLKRSVSLSNPVVKARSMKNKQDIQDYLHVRGNKHSKAHDREKQQKSFSPRSSDELFPVGHDMYDEYKKYEEMYRRERDVGDDDQQQSARDLNDELSSNEDSPPPQLDRIYKNEKVNADSAYGRKSPKMQQQKPGNGQRQGAPQLATMKHSPSSSGSDISASVPAKQYLRLTKFCHECGTKYPLDCAKFCVECGIKRLIL